MKTLVVSSKDNKKNQVDAKSDNLKIVTENEVKKEETPQAENQSTEEISASDEQKAEIQKKIEKFKPEPVLTADGRIQKMEEFAELSKRYNILKVKSNDLKKFIAGNDKIGAKIIFKNSQGFEFEVQNSNVIATLSDAASKELNILLNEAENEVVTFLI